MSFVPKEFYCTILRICSLKIKLKLKHVIEPTKSLSAIPANAKIPHSLALVIMACRTYVVLDGYCSNMLSAFLLWFDLAAKCGLKCTLGNKSARARDNGNFNFREKRSRANMRLRHCHGEALAAHVTFETAHLFVNHEFV